MKWFALLCCALWLCPAPIQAQGFVMLGPDLEPVGVTLRGLSADMIEVTDWQGNESSIKTSEVLRLSGGARAYNWPSTDWVKATLRDGQVLVGKMIEADDDESIRLTLSIGPEVEVALDSLVSLSMARNAELASVQEDDVMLLANGEQLTGFVETISTTSVGFVVGDADDPIQIPIERVRSLTIANKPKPVEAAKGLFRVRLSDDSSLLLKEVALDPDQQTLSAKATLGLGAEPLSLPMNRISQIEPISDRYALQAVSGLPMQLVAGGEVFGVKMPPRNKPDGLHLHAPTTVGFELPRGASRLTLMVEMNLQDPDLPPERLTLAGCELVVYDGDKAVGGHTLKHDESAKRLNLPIKTRNLRLEIKPGVNGPVLDRVRVFAAEVLISR